jgi:hypothetical protein
MTGFWMEHSQGLRKKILFLPWGKSCNLFICFDMRPVRCKFKW